ncbi:MAG TPA: VWA domain-containing protein [Vicinamibacterales bacterium]|nr:VWA domain-containing protein [Vicinamibacterales bacterium]
MRYRYTRFTGDPLGDLDLEDLVAKLSDFLMSSGFGDPQGLGDEDRTMQALHDAILDALFNGGMLSDEVLDRLLGDPADADQEAARARLEQIVQDLIDRMKDAGYITGAPDLDAERQRRQAGRGGQGEEAPEVRFEVTDKALDFLGYRALRDLLGAMGKSSFGRHDTHEHATGIETNGAPKPYEFGDTLNLDATGTILNAVRRQNEERLRPGRGAGGGTPGPGGIAVRHEDLMVVEGEYQSSCATVLMLDCSHSMILYGEDRFTPAKRVALALSQLIRTQYPGDALKVVLFHDSAEEIPLGELGRVRVGPYYTNTREGLRLARRLLDRQRKDMRQIIMITDGKPSALTRPDGRIYKNAFGLDPFIVSETFAEVAACRKSGIMINTFMLARDYDLVSFVRRVAEICRGKAYFTTPYTLGQYVLMDYMDKKTKTLH